MRHQLAVRLLAVLALMFAGAAASTTQASAAHDTTPPALNLPVRGTFVPLSTISATGTYPYDGSPLETQIKMRVQWTATDASGLCGFRTRYVLDEDYPEDADWVAQTSSAWSSNKSLTAGVSDYDDQEGGGMDKLWGFEVSARDCADNITTKFVRFAPIVFQEDGQSYQYGTLNVSTTGAWSSTTCSCWSGTKALKTTAKGARINFVLPLADDGSGTTVPVALAMERAPDRGKADVLIDGARVATIDTYASTKIHRSLVWVGRVPLGTHTVSVVNQATSGRARIDVDALAISPGTGTGSNATY